MRKQQESELWRTGDKQATFYQDALERAKQREARLAPLVHVIKPEIMPWEECVHGKLKHVINDQMPVLSKNIDAYIQEIPANGHSGKHRHMAEEVVFVLEGKGYDLHWDVEMRLTEKYEWDIASEPRQFEWEAGDLICIPVNTVHQHFNNDPECSARIISMTNNLYKFLDLEDLEQLESASETTP